MIKVVKENPCAECGIKGLYENCKDECVQYRKWYQYQQGRADAIVEYKNRLKEEWLELDDDLSLSDDFYNFVDNVAEQLKE